MAGNALVAEIIAPSNIVASPTDVNGWKQRIAASWKAAAEGILRVSKDLFDAKSALNAQDKSLWQELAKQLHDELIISESIQKKLLVIGGKYGNFTDVAASLPPRYNAIYQLTDLTKSQLEKLVKTKKLTPTLEDREIAALLVSGRSITESETSNVGAAFPVLRLIQTKKRISTDAKTSLKSIVRQIRKLDGFELKLTAEGTKLIGEYEE